MDTEQSRGGKGKGSMAVDTFKEATGQLVKRGGKKEIRRRREFQKCDKGINECFRGVRCKAWAKVGDVDIKMVDLDSFSTDCLKTMAFLFSRIVRFPWQLSKVKVQRTIAKAVKVWSDVTPLTFTEVQEGGVDIIIDFSRYWHGDNLPFDGPGGVLAHAFYPRTPRAGNVHFDYDEMWTIGTDLLQVAAHEFGHALGLQHSTVPKSLMSPYYSFRYPLSLAEDDKQGIQYLYGRPQHTSHHRYEHFNQNIETNELPSSHNPTQEPNACDTDFDAVSMIRGELFFFKSKYVWRLRDQYLQPGYPALASRHWWGIPDHIDAAFEDSSGNFWFFQVIFYLCSGARYWIYDGENQVSGPKFISELGLSANGIEAALKWALEKNEKILFFKGSDYWRFNMNTNHVDNIYPSSINDWRGIPHNIDGTFQDEYGDYKFNCSETVTMRFSIFSVFSKMFQIS
uniref:Matrix metallopeptidase 11 n=1 Tax=Callorhinchus milii TaxID=7868 RepID=A0A4W3JC41_CALMI